MKKKVLVLFSLAVLIPIIIVTGIIISIGRNALWKSIQEKQEEIALRIANNIYLQIKNNTKLVLGIANMELMELRKPRIKSVFNNLMKINDGLLELVLMRKSGQEILKIKRINNKMVSSRNLINRRRRKEFRTVLKKKTYVKYNLSAERTPYILILGRGRKCVVLAKVNLTNIWETIAKIRIGQNGYAFIVDNNGILVAHPAEERVIAHADFSNLPIVKDFMAGKKNVYRTYQDESGDRVISFYSPVPEIDWAVVVQQPYKEVMKDINKMIRHTLLWSIIFAGLFIFIGIRLVSGMINPILELREAAKDISKGKFDTTVIVQSKDEIGELAQTFNSMAKSLHELEQLRQDLISMIVHDMKSPLSGIVGSLDYLLKSGKNLKTQKEILAITRKSTDNLLELVQNLLDVSRMEDGKLKLNFEQIKIKDFIKDITDNFQVIAESEEKTFSFSVEDNLPIIKVDKGIIKRVMNNLLFNSLHHTINNGKIWLNVSKINGNIQFEIGDDGVGIPEEYRTRIFEKFVQVEKKRAHLRTGTGLGLTFCKMAVELHKGNIWVESKEGKGSKFFFTL